MKGRYVWGVCLLSAAAVRPALAVYPVTVVESLPITMQVVPAMTSIQSTLAEILKTDVQIGTAVQAAGDKQVAMISEAARAQREADIFGRQTERLERARDSYTVPDSICSESASGVAATVGRTSRAAASRLAGGQGISRSEVQKSVAAVPVGPRQGSYRSAAIHAGYCTAAEAALYGGTDLCPSVSTLPGGDIEVRSLLDGAGPVGKTPDLTFSQDQIDASMAYLKNSARHDGGRTPGKGDIQTATGREYQGLMTQYKAIQSAASQPQLELIAASQANPATRDALKESLQTPSAAWYFTATASKEAQRTGVISEREFEAFEVGRRYANTGYASDLQKLSGDNLLREQVRVQSLNSWLLLSLKNEQRLSNIIQGQLLSLAAEDHYAPQFQVLSGKMSSGVGAYDN